MGAGGPTWRKVAIPGGNKSQRFAIALAAKDILAQLFRHLPHDNLFYRGILAQLITT